MRPGSFACVLLGLTAVPLSAAEVASPAPRPAATKPRTSTTEPLEYENCKSYNYPERHAAILELKAKIDPQVILIGDSITHHWGGPPSSRLRDGEKVLKSEFADYRTLNLGFGHDRTQHVIWRLQNGEIDGTNPDWVVIHIGTNNLNDRNTPAEIMAGIKAVCAEVEQRTPKARIVLMSILPRQRQGTHPLRKTLAELNALIAAHAVERGYVHLDIGGQFLDDKGDIPKELMPDALHLSADGYRIWAKALREVFESKPAP
jgi:lysophospholipase L1-like esterase